jgi:hypothetical protein
MEVMFDPESSTILERTQIAQRFFVKIEAKVELKGRLPTKTEPISKYLWNRSIDIGF